MFFRSVVILLATGLLGALATGTDSPHSNDHQWASADRKVSAHQASGAFSLQNLGRQRRDSTNASEFPVRQNVGRMDSSRPVMLDEEKPVTRIALGSCVKQDRPVPIWKAIVKDRPELFLLIGDNIYGDTNDMDELRAKYAQLGRQPGFALLRSRCKVLATWDDHDYGANDAGRDFPKKVASQRVFNDFFDVPIDSPRRQRPGIYDAQTFGPDGKRVQVILLDTRYFRSPLNKRSGKRPPNRGPYLPTDDPEATVLGAAQWEWLEKQLRQPAEVRVIASSIQVVPEEHGWEYWANFPDERNRLFELIRKTKANGVVFISGDRHLAEISRLAPNNGPVKYPLYDLTSSSLNSPSGGGNENEPNRHRLGNHFLKKNYGTIEIDWEVKDPMITLGIKNETGTMVRTQVIRLSELQSGQ